MAVHAKPNLVMVLSALLVAGGIACAPAHTAWARQDLWPAVASDPGDGVLGDPGDGFGGDPGDGFDGDSNDGSDAHSVRQLGGAGPTGDPGDGDGVLGISGDPGDGDERLPICDWHGPLVRLLMMVVARAAR